MCIIQGTWICTMSCKTYKILSRVFSTMNCYHRGVCVMLITDSPLCKTSWNSCSSGCPGVLTLNQSVANRPGTVKRVPVYTTGRVATRVAKLISVYMQHVEIGPRACQIGLDNKNFNYITVILGLKSLSRLIDYSKYVPNKYFGGLNFRLIPKDNSIICSAASLTHQQSRQNIGRLGTLSQNINLPWAA